LKFFTGFLAIVAFSSMGIVSDTFADVQLRLYSIPVFCGFLVIKMLFSVYIVLQWINEYYEITPTVIYHRSGVIFKKEEKYILGHIRMVEVFQSFYGRLLNFGTIGLFDYRRNKYEDMFMIHNPMRYSAIIETLIPNSDGKKKTIVGARAYRAFD